MFKKDSNKPVRLEAVEETFPALSMHPLLLSGMLPMQKVQGQNLYTHKLKGNREILLMRLNMQRIMSA